MAKGRGRCAAPGCGRFVGGGQVACGRHQHRGAFAVGDGDGFGVVAADDEGFGAARPDPDERPGLVFRRRLEAGDYRGLFGPGAAEAVARAAADPGLEDEVGVLRVALARLVAEEADDAVKVATAVARVAAVLVQAARARRSLAGEEGDEGAAGRTLLAALRAAGLGDDPDGMGGFEA